MKSSFRLRVEDIDWEHLNIFNRYGKTKKSKRYLPISDRMVPELTRLADGRKEGWLFPRRLEVRASDDRV